MKRSVAAVAVGLFGLFACVDAEPERHIYDRGETGFLVIRNLGHELVAVGGCNPSFYEERVSGSWLPDPLIRPACGFFTNPDGTHELERYEIIRPGSSLRVPFPTDWISEPESVIRVHQRVSVDCEPPKRGQPLRCSGVANLVSDPILIVEPGTAESVRRR
jgi:hypothetical protein